MDRVGACYLYNGPVSSYNETMCASRGALAALGAIIPSALVKTYSNAKLYLTIKGSVPCGFALCEVHGRTWPGCIITLRMHVLIATI